jgi:homoserine O-acetyltransferase
MSANLIQDHLFDLKAWLSKPFEEISAGGAVSQATIDGIRAEIKNLELALKHHELWNDRLSFLLNQLSSSVSTNLHTDNEFNIGGQFNTIYRTVYANHITTGFSTYSLGHVSLQKGGAIPDCKIAYKTFGSLNAEKSNVIVYPTWYSGYFIDNEWLIGKGMALDPTKYFIIVVGALGNGQSSSPNNTQEPYDHSRFPNITLYDNVTLQHRLVTEVFGITKVKLVVGWSMGAQQSFQWGALYPDMVERIAPFCGSAKTSPHNYVFLDSLKQTLTTDSVWNNGFYDQQPKKGIRAFAHVYAGWGFSQPFYRHEEWRKLGFNSLEDFLIGFWEGFFLQRDANNLLAMIWTWQHADISANPVFHGDLVKALRAIKAKSFVLSPEIDLYFPKEDNQWEVNQMPDAEYILIPGVWGHFAGGGLNPADTKFLDNHLKRLLSS